jgi:hypothetical protein
MALLRTYRFTDKDPVVDELRTMVKDAGLDKRLEILAELASLHKSTPKNLFHGDTKRPQNATVMAIAHATGHKRQWVKDRSINVDEELVFARKWNAREQEKRAAEHPTKKKKRA